MPSTGSSADSTQLRKESMQKRASKNYGTISNGLTYICVIRIQEGKENNNEADEII